MDPMAVPVPPVLRERLGEEASRELGEMMGQAGGRWRDDVLALATERFGRMLAEEAARIRGEMAHLRAELKEDIARLRAELKGDIAGLRAELKGDIAGLRAELKGDIAALRADLKGDMAAFRGDLMKWSFAFWVGEVAVILALLAFVTRR